MRIQHPRATDATVRGPPSRVAVPVGAGSYETVSVDDGYVEVDDEDADAAMDGLASVFDVEYDRDTGEVVTDGDTEESADADVLLDDGADLADETATPDTADDTDAGDGDDLEAWANWNREDWFALSWGDRKSDVEDGLVDDHLEEIIDIETSGNVEEAAEARLAELEGDE